MVEVFMCHKREDRQFVINFAKGLKYYGVKCWIYEVEMLPGDDLIDKISQAIEKCDFFLAFVSVNSVKSNWVKDELSKAMRKEIAIGKPFVIPVKIDNCEIPSSLSHKIYADLTKPENRLHELGRILKTIKKPEEAVIESDQKHLEKAELAYKEKKLKKLYESLKSVAEDNEKKLVSKIQQEEIEKKVKDRMHEITRRNEERLTKLEDRLTSSAIVVENDVDKEKSFEAIKKPNAEDHIEEIKKRKEEKPRGLTADLIDKMLNIQNRQDVKQSIEIKKQPTHIGKRAIDLKKNLQEYSIRINSEPQSLEGIRSFIVELLKETDFSEKEMSIIELVTYEACANSIEHAHKNIPDLYVDLLFQIYGKKILISITDSGEEFVPTDIPDIDISEKIAHKDGRGMGLPIIKALMDEVTFERTRDHQNCITMKKDFSKVKPGH